MNAGQQRAGVTIVTTHIRKVPPVKLVYQRTVTVGG